MPDYSTGRGARLRASRGRQPCYAQAGKAEGGPMYPTATAPLVLNERVPDPAVKVLDPSFEKYRLPLASVERLSQGYRWAEGPVYFGDARCLLWSDIPNNRIMRWDEETGATSVYPQALELRQRQHPRPPGPPGHRRARPARHPHRIRRPDHRADGPLRRQAAEFAERHRGEVRRLDLVHRHERRHRRQLERRGRPSRNCRSGSIASTARPGRRRSSPTAWSSGRTGSRSRPTRRSST